MTEHPRTETDASSGRLDDAEPATTGSIGGVTLVNGRTFLIAAPGGAIHRSTDGVVFEDLRVLSRAAWHVRADGGDIRRELIGSASTTPFQASNLCRPDPAFHDLDVGEFYVERQWVGRGVRMSIELHAVRQAVTRTIALDVDTDFAHIFDVKSGTSTGTSSVLTWDEDTGELSAPDDPTLRVVVRSAPAPTAVDADGKRLTWELSARQGTTATVSVTFEPHWDGRPAGIAFPLEAPISRAWPIRSLHAWRSAAPSLISDDPRWAHAVDTCLVDLASLRIFDPVRLDRIVIAAGAPWYMTLFGRDSLLTAWMVMPFLPELALGTLQALAELQGTATDPASEEEPGKIIHELRRHGGDDAFARRARYYGTIDATPLFVMVAAEAVRWGHLRDEALDGLRPGIRAAIDWCRRRIADDPLGFLRYRRSTGVGLVNQGWKDSWDGVNFSDGRLPTGPIALSEVQGYAFAALRGAALLARTDAAIGLDAEEIDHESHRLAERFEAHFWNPATSSYAIALDGTGRRVDSMTTNPGHAIWCGIADTDRAGRHLDRAMTELFTGWGLRTLSPTDRRYDPLSYHNGSVWPHDTAIVAAGAATVARSDIVAALGNAALDTAERCQGRPPELFGGVDRTVIDTPVAYPQSCSPQAWASASTLLHLRTTLGLAPPRGGGPPVIAPPDVTGAMQLSGIRVGGERYTATVDRDGVGIRRESSEQP